MNYGHKNDIMVGTYDIETEKLGQIAFIFKFWSTDLADLMISLELNILYVCM